MSRLHAILLLLAPSFWAACATTPDLETRPRVSENIYTMDSGFTISVREASVRYNILLKRIHPPDQPLPVTVTYENPAAPEAPFTEDTTWPAGENFLRLVSPPLQSLKAGTPYRVSLTVFNSPARTVIDDTHEVFILSNIDTPAQAVEQAP